MRENVPRKVGTRCAEACEQASKLGHMGREKSANREPVHRLDARPFSISFWETRELLRILQEFTRAGR